MADKNPGLSTLASNIKQGVESRLKDLHTSMPGIMASAALNLSANSLT